MSETVKRVVGELRGNWEGKVFQTKPYSGTFPEKAMAPHSSTLAWKIEWTEEPGRLQSMG